MGKGFFTKCFGTTKSLGEAESSKPSQSEARAASAKLSLVRGHLQIFMLEPALVTNRLLQGQVQLWTTREVQSWLQSVGAGKHATCFEGIQGQVSNGHECEAYMRYAQQEIKHFCCRNSWS